jgi:hypothetical protein
MKKYLILRATFFIFIAISFKVKANIFNSSEVSQNIETLISDWKIQQGHIYSTFVIPNESDPQNILPLWKNVSNGVYLSVGSERGFIGAAYSNADHLLLIDHESIVVFFNSVNILLLKSAQGDRLEYIRLRSNPDYLIQKIPNLQINDREKIALKFAAQSLMWRKLTSEFNNSEFWNPTNEAKGKFTSVRYHLDPIAFKKLSRMAMENRIYTIQQSLTNFYFINLAVSDLIEQQLELSVVDISNAWSYDYIGLKNTQKLLTLLNSVTNKKTQIILTELFYPVWRYRSSTFEALEGAGFFEIYYSTYKFSNNNIFLKYFPLVKKSNIQNILSWLRFMGPKPFHYEPVLKKLTNDCPLYLN